MRDRRAIQRRQRPALALCIAAAVSALVLSLGVSGTFSAFSTAVLTNSNDRLDLAGAVLLTETDGTSTCKSSDGSLTPANSSTCSSINKYNGSSVLSPGSTALTSDVTFSNVGTIAGHTFSLTAGACTATLTATATVTFSPGANTNYPDPSTTSVPSVRPLCTNGELTVAITCNAGNTFGGTPWTGLVRAAAAPPTNGAVLTFTAPGAELAINAQWTCRFTVQVIAGANVDAQNTTVSQQLTWTLNQ